MKKLIFIIFLSLTVFSCKKEEQEELREELKPTDLEVVVIKTDSTIVIPVK